MENKDERLEELIKSKNKFKLAEKCFGLGIIIAGSIAIAGGGCWLGGEINSRSALNSFKSSEEYLNVIEKDMADPSKDLEELNYILSDNYAVDILKSSSSPLKLSYENSQKLTFAGIGMYFGGFLLTMASAFLNKEMRFKAQSREKAIDSIITEYEYTDNLSI